MSNAYRDFMSRQCLSEQAKQAFYRDLQISQQKTPDRFLIKLAGIAACIVLMIPITAFALETIFHISIVEFISGNTTSKFNTGFQIHYPDVSSRPLTDFSEDIQTTDGYTRMIYSSWQDGEEALGITLVNNAILQSEDVLKTYAYIQKNGSVSERVHCYGVYEGKNNQLYRASLSAAYRYKGMHIMMCATVTCAHPEISPEEESQFHWSGNLYENDDIAEMYREIYVAPNGITATIITVDKTQNNDRDYRACFAADGVSYNITVSSDRNQPEKGKAVLTEIIDAFVFDI